MAGYYPVMLDLAGKRCTVVGGGSVAERKIAGLLEAAASVKVISLEWSGVIEGWRSDGKLEAVRKNYAPGDLEGAFLVIAAADEGAVNRRVCEDAKLAGALVNAADRREYGDFIVPSVVRRGKLVLAVSTSGAYPPLGAAIRSELERAYGEDYEAWVELLQELRLKALDLVKNAEQRRLYLTSLLASDGTGRIRSGGLDALRAEALESLRKLTVEQAEPELQDD